jgi:hypothetical protein
MKTFVADKRTFVLANELRLNAYMNKNEIK